MFGLEAIGNFGTGNFIQSGGTHNLGLATVSFEMALGNNTGSTGTYSLSVGALNVFGSEYIGNSGTGNFIQSGGTHTLGSAAAAAGMSVGNGPDAVGTYSLSGGTLNVFGVEAIGYVGTGTFIQSGGLHNLSSATLASSSMQLGVYLGAGDGTYSLSGGTLNVFGTEYIGDGGRGNFIQTGGTHNLGSASISSTIYLGNASGSAGTYSLSNGALNVFGTESIGGAGTGNFIQNGGTHNLGSATGFSSLILGQYFDGTYSLSGGALNVFGVEALGGYLIGTFVQTGGVHNLGSATHSDYISIGVNAGAVGTYLLSGSGVLNVLGLGESIGNAGTGSFIQTGGTHTVGSMAAPAAVIIGNFPSGSGTLSLGGTGALSVFGNVCVGGNDGVPSGKGVLNVSGGSMSVSNLVKVWDTAGTALNLSGGTLSAGSIDMNGNLSRFNWTGGVLALTNSDLTLATGQLVGASVNLPANKGLIVSGTVTNPGGSSIIVDGGIFSAGSLLSSGFFQFNSGTFRLTSSSLTVGNSGFFGNVLQLNANQHIDIVGSPVTVDPGALLVMNGLTSSLSGGSMTNNGIISGVGRISNNLINSPSGSIRATGSDWIQFTGASNTNNGQINVLNGGQVEFTQGLANSSTGVISGRGILRTGGTGLGNSGNVVLSGGVSDVYGDLSNNSGGKITLSGLANVSFWDDVTNNAGGSIKVSPGSAATFFGAYGGGGITGGGSVYFESDITPGFSPAAISIDGNVSIGGQSKLHIELAGKNRGTQYDAIDITGNATLDGTLAFSTLGGFIPLPGDTFAVLGYGSRSGDISVVNETGFAGLSFAKSYSATTLTLIASALPGDANLDGRVDIRDLRVLATHYHGSANWLGADFNGSGVVDADDLGLLARNWQAGVSAPAGESLGALLVGLELPTNVPEPTILSAATEVALLGYLGPPLVRKRKRYPS